MKAKIIKFLYKKILKPIFFLSDPEEVHDHMTAMGVLLGKLKIARVLTKWVFSYQNQAVLAQNILGVEFKNPIGLAAGFDKNAQLLNILPSVGFGFAEVGSITAEPCVGNPKPRLWRLKKSNGLLVYYGLKNDGAVAIAKRLKPTKFSFPVGISIAKTNCELTADTNEGVKDYLKGYTVMQDIGSYVTINISCPNAFGGQPFTSADRLDLLLRAINQEPKTKPIFLKVSPDLNTEEVDALLEVAGKYSIDGLIISNLTKKRENTKLLDTEVPEVGGMSGKIVEDLSNQMIAYVYKKMAGRFVIIGCGGVFSAEDAYKKIKLGASLIQMISGMIFEGPQVIGQINQGLVKLLNRDGYTNISQAIGVDNR